MHFEDKEVMEVKESEKIENDDFKKHEKTVRFEESASLEENLRDEDLNLDSVIDVTGKILDFPLIDGDASAVEEVYMYKNELNLIPRAVGRFKGLKTLKFFANEVNLFPEEFKNLVEIECLQVKVAVPGVGGLELSKLKNLKELELSRVPQRPSAFPILNEIAGLKRLTKLSVCHFSIRYLPPEIACLSNLEYLDLSFNKMKILPDEITSLNLLISLKVSNNKLVELPRLSCLQRLENLDLSSNRLTSLGCLELESMHNLQCLNLQHNQLYGCQIQIPHGIICNLEGNGNDQLNDESAEMDVYEGAVQEIQSNPCSSVAESSHSKGLLTNNQCLGARREKVWKRRHNTQTKDRQERLSNRKKWKIDVTSQSSSEKCITCKVSGNNDSAVSLEDFPVDDVELDNKDIYTEGEIYGNLHTGDEKFIALKESVDGCSCSTIDSDVIQKEVEANDSQSSTILDTHSDVVEVLGEGPISEGSCLIKAKRHSDKDLDNPKPAKTRRPTSDPSYMSCQYSEQSFCGVGDHLPDGFYDAGRDRPFMSLGSYEKNLHVNSREVILLDRERDEKLDAILLCARTLLSQFKKMNKSIDKHRDVTIDNLQIASLLALFVSDNFGGSDKSAIVQRTRKSVSGSNFQKPFVCTCATGISGDSSKAIKHGMDTVEDTVFLDFCEKSLQSMKERYNSVIVPIGGLQFGVCRHRALLMKYLCDRMEPQIPCELVRGYLDFSPHAWNVIVVKRADSLVRMIVDACHPHDIRVESDHEYSCRYIPLSRMNEPIVAGDDASPICSFPSLSDCEEIGKLSSTSLMHCSVGSLNAAVKVRKLEVNEEASADEVKKFEYCCLGEVRMLSVLKHSCIVDFYGHQISSKWSLTEDGHAEGRTLQSAILMEYINGGSLKRYIEKLSGAGEKHVSPDLALSIARDVAYALTELHSKHIIHRDIKSENILIDLEKKKQDGTPIVKICDFDMAIPLHSYLHTCCISHFGVPQPYVCVGTPRWMAPEVLRAKDEMNLYGLEVDIWSFGCLLLELLTLQVPYYGLPESDIEKFLQKGERPGLTEELESLAQSEDKDFESETETLKYLVKLYHHCTEKDPADRPSAEKIYNSLVGFPSSVTTTSSRSSEQE